MIQFLFVSSAHSSLKLHQNSWLCKGMICKFVQSHFTKASSKKKQVGWNSAMFTCLRGNMHRVKHQKLDHPTHSRHSHTFSCKPFCCLGSGLWSLHPCSTQPQFRNNETTATTTTTTTTTTTAGNMDKYMGNYGEQKHRDLEVLIPFLFHQFDHQDTPTPKPIGPFQVPLLQPKRVLPSHVWQLTWRLGSRWNSWLHG